MKIHENYLNTDDIESLCNVAKRVQRTDNLRTNFGTWSDSIVQYSSPVMIYDIPDEYTTNLRQYSELEDMTAFMLYFWSHGSYIPWHDDNHASVTGTIYLNGVSQGTHSAGYYFYSTDKWTLGGEYDYSDITNEYKGLLDEVAIWKDDLTAAEVTALYNSGAPLYAGIAIGVGAREFLLAIKS